MLDLAFLLALHAVAAVIWVGGMAFAYCCLRPAAVGSLEPPERLALWRSVFARFFPAVWGALAVLLVTGYLLVGLGFGGFAQAGLHIHLMHGLALVMGALFAHVFFAPWRRFRRTVDGGDKALAASELDSIRRLVAVNLTLGILVVAIGASGRYWP